MINGLLKPTCFVLLQTILLGGTFAQDAAQPQKVLFEAIEFTQKSFYKTEQNFGDIKLVIYSARSPSGKYLHRREAYRNGTLVNCALSNESGKYLVTPGVAVKCDFYSLTLVPMFISLANELEKIINLTERGQCGYSLEKKDYSGRRCNYISIKLPDDVTRATLLGIPKGNIKLPKQEIDQFPTIIQVIAAEAEPFVLSIVQYNSSGRELGGLTFDNVTLNPLPDLAIFELPSDISVMIAESYGEMDEIIKSGNKDSTNKPTGNFSVARKSLMITILASMSAIIVLCVFLALRKKNK